MITCTFEDGGAANLRHVAADAILINDKNQVLLTRRGLHISRPNKYALPGGYLSRDEEIMTAAVRELKEETGYDAKVQYLFCINDNFDETTRKDDRQTVPIVFVLKVIGGGKQLNDEVTEITWFDEENLPDEDEFAFDHRRVLIKFFQYLRSPFTLPIFGKEIFL
jgi:ADP-ribose pyrophosphatase YjhB (NUDIX family)